MARPVVVAILLAGGSGDRADPERVSGGDAKQFREVGGAPMWEHSLATFERCDSIDSVIVVVSQDAPAPDPSFHKIASVTLGGPTRQASLGAGLACLPGGVDIVVVHDAARPVISASL
ncbi:MAG TPA: 2-C-methyl-D-erythritol 4-phosphate cytidylyltransferase, partial [Actinomycetota bacterium]|nr:2-C-methyl-D-erythritol 4-phosphate cytidylyltransferase [Actinomycetota bacterium]